MTGFDPCYGEDIEALEATGLYDVDYQEEVPSK